MGTSDGRSRCSLLWALGLGQGPAHKHGPTRREHPALSAGTHGGPCGKLPGAGRGQSRRQGAGRPPNTPAPRAAAAFCFAPNLRKAQKVKKTQSLSAGRLPRAHQRSEWPPDRKRSLRCKLQKGKLKVKAAPVTLCSRQHTSYCHKG